MPPRTRQNLHRQGIIGELTELGHYMTDSEAGLEKLNKTPVSRLKKELKRLKSSKDMWQKDKEGRKEREKDIRDRRDRDMPTYDDGVLTMGAKSGGSIKKYAHGGSVRKTKLSDY